MAENVTIRKFDKEKDCQSVANLWNLSLPTYEIPQQHMIQLLAKGRASHHVALNSISSTSSTDQLVGFAIAFVVEKKIGYFSALVVKDGYRRKGIGSKLLRQSCQRLLEDLGCETLRIGSEFPRFWCGVPSDIPFKHQDFFSRRGFFPADNKVAKDLCLSLIGYKPPPGILEKASRKGFVFTPWTVAGYDECMHRQRKNFDNAGWIAAYATLARSGLHRQVMIASNLNGDQMGWALMIEPGMPVWNDLAFPQLLGSKTALIGCVGVDSDARNQGVGHALVVHALLDLRARGMERVFVDWVDLEDWYEKLGFQVWRRYRPSKLQNNLDIESDVQ